VFRHLLHPIVRFLMALFAAGAVAEPALAVADVTDVSVTVTIAESTGAQDDVSAEIRVKGTDLNDALISIPGFPQQVPLDPVGDDFVLGISFANEAELNSLLPAGNYGLSVDGGAVLATIAYDARPAVPSPSIDQPGGGDVIPPGPVEVLFTACSICSLTDDSVEALLEEGVTEVASETLTENDDAWIPPDGIGGDLQLGESSQFTATITHTAVRAKNVSTTGDDTTFDFTANFVRSDTVSFETGFGPPTGDFCLVVNDLTPPAECAALNDPLLGILDSSGLVSTSVGGHAVDYDITVGAKGDITGAAMADLDDDTIKETVGAVRGKLGGKAGLARQKLSFPLESPGLGAKLKVGVSDELSIPADTLARVQKASGSLGGVKLSEETLDDQTPLPVAPQGWRLDFTLGAGGVLESGLLTLEGGRSFELQGSHKFKLASDLSSLKLQTADKGIRVQLKNVGLDDSTQAVSGGDLSYKILGQSGRVSLP